MAEKKTVQILLDQTELDAVRQGLELARRSCDRAAKANALEGVAAVYRRQLAVLTALQTRLPEVV